MVCDDSTDEQLFVVYRNNSSNQVGQDAATKLVERYRPSLLGQARSQFKIDDNEAEDIVQRAFMRAFMPDGLVEFDPEKGSFSCWIRMLVDSRGMDEIRRKKKRPTPQGSGEEPAEDFVQGEGFIAYDERELPPDANIQREELVARFWEFFGTLDGDQQALIKALHIDQLTHREACRSLGLHRNTEYKRRYDRILTRMRAYIGEVDCDLRFGLDRRSKRRVGNAVGAA